MKKIELYILSLILITIASSFIEKSNVIENRIVTINTKSSKQKKEKVLITKDIKEYELSDGYIQFDDTNENSKLELNRYGKTLRIINSKLFQDSGYNITIEINDKLEIQKAEYKKWTVTFNHGVKTSYKVKSISLRMNKNPFNHNNDIRGEYKLVIEKIIGNKHDSKFEYKAKFKLFNEINIFNKCLLNISYTTFSKVNGRIYKTRRLDKGFVLVSDPCALLEKIELLKREYKYENKRIGLGFIVSKNGHIENNSYHFVGSYPDGLKMKLMKIFTNETKWQPAELNNKKIRAFGAFAFD